jgi:hypothetical protein
LSRNERAAAAASCPSKNSRLRATPSTAIGIVNNGVCCACTGGVRRAAATAAVAAERART